MFPDQPWDADLDEAQLTAVLHDDAPLVVVAGAGTGKTRTLTARVARLLERGTEPERILLLTFTRRAADDLMARAAALAGRAALARRLHGGTFHAVAHQVVRAYGETIGVKGAFSVLDPADAADVMDLLREEHGLAGREQRVPRAATLVDVYSRCVNTRRSLGEVVTADFPWCEPHLERIASLCRAYVEHKRARALLDFDDLLLHWRAALLHEHLGAELAAQFDHVLVDEYQDVNSLQVDIVRLLRPGGRGLTVVGDDAQAIFGFRGSQAAHLHEMASSLAGASVVRLERNFRSFQPILDVANVVRAATGGPSALGYPPALSLHAARTGGRRPSLVRCHDAGTEARAVVESILEHHENGRRLMDQAVLVRAAHHSDLVELELSARRLPYRKYGGLRFVEGAHVKDLVAAVRLLDNPADDLAWFRLLRLHDGIGPARARQLLETLPPSRPLGEQGWLETVAAAPAVARTALADTLAALSEAREARTTGARVERTLELLRPLVAARYEDAAARLADLDRLGAAAVARGDLGSWIGEITLDPPQSTSGVAGPPHLDEDYVVISTVHSAKGLEWPVVHLPHAVDGAFPSDMALRSRDGLLEETRLFYVALTRARDELIVYAPLRMPHRRRAGDDRHSYALASRFLTEEVTALCRLEERLPPRPPWPALASGSSGPGVALHSPAVAAALDLEGLWR